MLLNFNNDSAKCVTCTESRIGFNNRKSVIYIHIHGGSLRVCNVCNVALVFIKMSVF